MLNLNWRRGSFLGLALVVLLAACAPMQGRQSAGEYVDDATITAKVKAAFVGDPDIPASQIDVTTMDQIVQLSGFVEEAGDKTRAEQVAERVEGVRQVRNDIIVRP